MLPFFNHIHTPSWSFVVSFFCFVNNNEPTVNCLVTVTFLLVDQHWTTHQKAYTGSQLPQVCRQVWEWLLSADHQACTHLACQVSRCTHHICSSSSSSDSSCLESLCCSNALGCAPELPPGSSCNARQHHLEQRAEGMPAAQAPSAGRVTSPEGQQLPRHRMHHCWVGQNTRCHGVYMLLTGDLAYMSGADGAD